LPAHIFDEMAHFFTVYKNLEGKEAMAGDVNDRKAAVDVIRKSIDSYIDNFCK
ncbi:MAG: inorganic diphosphatase, partial [Ruminiclostridium sp.]|nr:inorganic diphosphatase [Ruminiclostridium sp.]